jgi:hypothetical protein
MRSPEKAKSLPKSNNPKQSVQHKRKTAPDEKRPALAVLHRSLSTAIVNEYPEAHQAVSTMVTAFARKKQRALEQSSLLTAVNIETAKLKDVIREKATDLEEQACKVAALEQEVRQN